MFTVGEPLSTELMTPDQGAVEAFALAPGVLVQEGEPDALMRLGGFLLAQRRALLRCLHRHDLLHCLSEQRTELRKVFDGGDVEP